MPYNTLIAGNWKMYGDLGSGRQELQAMIRQAASAPDSVGVLICPPATLLYSLSEVARNSRIALGGQDCHAEAQGAYTGDLSAAMLKEAGAGYVIVGHSERRQGHSESSKEVAAKAAAAAKAGLIPVICVGETLEERESGREEEVIGKQLVESIPPELLPDHYVIAYEPVWAIGTGKVATIETIAAMHRFISGKIPAGVKILYGGSVKPDNAAEILAVPHVSGVLVGGASLKADSFNAIIGAARQ